MRKKFGYTRKRFLFTKIYDDLFWFNYTISISKGNIDDIAHHLAIPADQLNDGLVRIDFKISTKHKPEIPSGNEFGANDQWIPGGKLPTGKSDAIIKTEGMIKDIDYFVIDLKTGEKIWK